MTTGIYGIYDSNSQDCLYVGQSIFIEERWTKHLSLLRRGKHRQQRFVEWVELNGEDSLKFCILEECAEDELLLNKLEMKWFNLESPKFYSKAPSENERWKHEESTKKKISESLKKRRGEVPTIEKECSICKETFLTNWASQVRCNDANCTSYSSSSRKRKCYHCRCFFQSKKRYCSIECRSKGVASIDNLSKEETREIRNYYFNQKMNFRDISQKLSISVLSIESILGIKEDSKNKTCPKCSKTFSKKSAYCSKECSFSHQAKYTDEDVLKMCELYVAGFSLAEIAKFYPISRQTVYKILLRNNVKMRK